jgi:hypothetical protein
MAPVRTRSARSTMVHALTTAIRPWPTHTNVTSRASSYPANPPAEPATESSAKVRRKPNVVLATMPATVACR